MRRFFYGIFVVALLSCCVWGYIYMKKQTNVEQHDIYNFVGQSAVFHVRVNNPQYFCNDFTDKSAFFENIYATDTFLNKITPAIIPDAVDSNFVVRRNSLFIISSAFVDKEQSLHFVHFIPLRAYVNIDDVLSKINDKNIRIYTKKYDGFLAVSSSEYALKQNEKDVLAGKTLSRDNLFLDGILTAGRYVEANVFVDFGKTHELVQTILNANTKHLVFLKNIARWLILDVNSAKNICNLSGFAYVNNQSALNLLGTQKKATGNTLKNLTKSTIFSLSFQVTNIDSLQNLYKEYIGENGADYYKNINNISDSIFFDANKFIRNIFPKEITLSYDSEQGWITTIKVSNGKNAAEEIAKLEQRSAFPKIIPAIFGEIFKLNRGNYTDVIDDYIVVSKNKISEFGKCEVLDKNTDYILDESLATLYLTPSGISKFFNAKLKPPASLFESFLMQIVSGKQKFYINANILFSKRYKEKLYAQKNNKNDDEKTNVDTVGDNKELLNRTKNVVFRQMLMDSKGNKYILLQYPDLKVELFDSQSKSLFKKQIAEKIESDISILNPHNRGVLYMLFNTENKIYMLNFDGDNMSEFPLDLPAAATNSVSAYSYDRNSDYRIFIACANKRIYLYSLNGQAIDGWKIPKTQGFIQNKIQFFRLNAKDYLVTCDNSKIYIFNRRGNIITDVKNKVEIKPEAEFEGIESPARVKTLAKSGRTIIINLKTGKVEIK